MGRVFIHATLSLDGFMAGPHDEVDRSFDYGSDTMAEKSMNEVGAVVLGNRGFKEGTMTEDRLLYGGMQVTQFVVRHDPRAPLTVGALTFTFVAGGIQRAAESAKAAAGDKNVALLGASIDQQCLRAGLVDEIVIHVCPLPLNDGIRLFENLGREIQLERLETFSTAQLTSLRFRVVRP